MRLATTIFRGDSATTAGGVLIGMIAAIVGAALMQAPPVWLVLICVGVLVFCGSLVATDAKLYWLTIFLASVPLNVTKLFFWSPEDVSVIKQQFGIYINENMVPQMYLSDLPLAMLLVMWLGELVSRRRRVEAPKALLLMAGFITWALVTVAQERAPLLGASWVIYELKLMIMFLWFVNARLGQRGVRHALSVLMLSLTLQAGVTFYTYAAQTGENVFGSLFGAAQSSEEARVGPSRGSGAAYVFEQGALRRGTGTIGTANLEAKYFVLLLPLALAGAACARRRVARLGAAVALVIGMAALYLTYSRGGLLTAMLALAIVPLLLARTGLWRRKAVVAAAVTAAMALTLALPMQIAFLSSRPQFTRTRLDQAIYGLQIWWQNPVAGVGLNNFNLYVSPIAFDGTFSGSPIHNHYLRIAIETGAIGFVLYFAFFAWAVRVAYRLTISTDRFVAATASGLCAALVGTSVYWLEDLFYDPIVRTQIWIAVALTASLAQIAAGKAIVPGGPMPAAEAPSYGGAA